MAGPNRFFFNFVEGLSQPELTTIGEAFGFTWTKLISVCTSYAINSIMWDPQLLEPLLIIDWDNDNLGAYVDRMLERQSEAKQVRAADLVIIHDSVAWQGRATPVSSRQFWRLNSARFKLTNCLDLDRSSRDHSSR